MSQYYRQSFWMRESNVDRIIHVKGHMRNEFEPIEQNQIDCSISCQDISSLVNFLIEEGYVRPIINNESRKDDVTIINRLIDVLDKHAVVKG